ncbi:alpha/beta-hydrolase [Dendrothele bispora CBS 962.96]|uniref:Alpha/beta-hydrolase n=1 Tax=Dendrothele bispora (strain CBS 962.96) TaxID=1314807 RepID=A0A4S8MYJ5_DENBC|nr:alpha/beta-hydrolase [Dendrothele bispora CBS 962.96]
MPVTTLSAAVHITPVVIHTFFSHGKRKAIKYKEGNEEEESRDDIFFDQAFNIVRAFIELGIRNTVESLQAFTNTHVPAPYWAAVSPVRIPLSSCNAAADLLIEWFGPEELKHVVGGERWWQVRGLDGLDAEWITQKEYLDHGDPIPEDKNKLSKEDKDILRMEKLETVMLYVHGGGYFWGSVNTHRYQIIRFARKIKGRAFAVNYRKAPQYPWPCPLHDVIAAYLYLIDPPPTALHKPVSPSKIVFAGDSAGGSLCLTALTVLRDMGVPLPSGAVLISPWVDLTHSLPSVMQNTETDIIPPQGFLAKPSPLWPVDPVPPKEGRAGPTTTDRPPEPGHADTLKPSEPRLEKDAKGDTRKHKLHSQEEMLQENSTSHENGDSSKPGQDQEYDIDHWEPKPPKVLMNDSDATPLELRSQIQVYATNEQLTHPLVSPILQGSLGNLPPLYIIAGDGEVLRDEIMYIAHRAAFPQDYPTRAGVLRDARRQKENVEKFTTPTKVHLQVFDGMCHVLTVFTFTESAKYAYRSIAEFVKHVTNDPASGQPFPDVHRHPSRSSTHDLDEQYPGRSKKGVPSKHQKAPENQEVERVEHNGILDEVSDVVMFTASVDELAAAATSTAEERVIAGKAKDDAAFVMLRDRVNIYGRIRPMEPREEIPALQIKASQIGIIKEDPCTRWWKGQQEWDKRFMKKAERAVKERAKIKAKAQRLLENARKQGLLLVREGEDRQHPRFRDASEARSTSANPVDGTIQEDRRWGPLDLDDENPPLSAIAKRRDTLEALALLKKSIYHSAPVTHATVPKLKPSDAVRAAFDPHDDPTRPPKQSVSEQQRKANIIPMHGLRIWNVLVSYFMKEKAKQAAAYVRGVGERAGERAGVIEEQKSTASR